MLRAIGVLFTSLVAIAVVAASPAGATEAPYFKVGGKRLGEGETRELTVQSEGSQVLTNPVSNITVTCKKLKANAGATIKGSAVGEPGTSSGTFEYSDCTVERNGEKCQVSGKAFTTEALKGELAYSEKTVNKGTKSVEFITPASGTVLAKLKFTPEAGGKCTIAETSIEGSIVAENLNSKKEVIGVEEHEAEEEFGFTKAFTGEACKVKASVVIECKKAAEKSFGSVSTWAKVAKLALVGLALWGRFHH